MMIPYHWKDAAEGLERCHIFFSNDRMLPHDSHFSAIQTPWFKKDVVGPRFFQCHEAKQPIRNS